MTDPRCLLTACYERAEAIAQADPDQHEVRATPYVWRDPTTIPLRPWLYRRWLLRGTVTAIVAPGGIGKTTLLVGTALALVTGRPLHEHMPVGGASRVWIWNLEDDLDELSHAIQAAALRYDVAERDLADRLFVNSAMEGATRCTATEEGGAFRIVEPVVEGIVRELIARNIDLLIIDPFVSSHQVDENANTKIDAITKRRGKVAKQANCSIILSHHTKKVAGQKVSAELARGAVALIYAARQALVLNRMDADQAAHFNIDDEAERKRYFAVQDDKHNRALAENADWFRLASVDLGNGGPMGGDSIGGRALDGA